MSAFHAFRHKDSIQILADAAVTDEHCVLVAVVRKCMIIQQALPAVICLRYADASAAVKISNGLRATKAASVDDLLQRASDFVQELPGTSIPACDFLICALSTTGPVMLACACHDGWQYAGMQPFKLTQIEGSDFGAGPAIEPEDTARLRPWWPNDPEWPRRRGAEYFEFMRRQPQTLGGRHGFYIGGWVDLVTIAASGVTVETLRVWPDVEGFPIDPERKFFNDDNIEEFGTWRT